MKARGRHPGSDGSRDELLLSRKYAGPGWEGEVILVKRSHYASDEQQPLDCRGWCARSCGSADSLPTLPQEHCEHGVRGARRCYLHDRAGSGARESLVSTLNVLLVQSDHAHFRDHLKLLRRI